VKKDAELAGFEFYNRTRLMIAFLIHPFPDFVFRHFEGVGDVAHKVCDQDSILLVAALGGIEVSLNAPIVFEDYDQRFLDLHHQSHFQLGAPGLALETWD
jgi:hypothetical protein